MTLNKLYLPVLLLFVSISVNAGNSTHTKSAYTSFVKDSLPVACSKSEEIEKIITDAISLGAPIYNEGLHMACYRIYEWAGYKILYEYGKTCKTVETILKTAIDNSHGDYSDTEKAWLMRQAFDKILGVPTETNQPDKDPLQKKG